MKPVKNIRLVEPDLLRQVEAEARSRGHNSVTRVASVLIRERLMQLSFEPSPASPSPRKSRKDRKAEVAA